MRFAATSLLVLAAAVPAFPQDRASIDVAKIALVEGAVEVASADGVFAAASEGQTFKAGWKLRTTSGIARLEFPFMTLLASAGTQVGVSGAKVLSLDLEGGRVELSSSGADILKVIAGSAEVRGEGWVVVRREGSNVLVSAVDGKFFVASAGKTATLNSGDGAVVSAQQAPATTRLADRPKVTAPGSDAAYVTRGAKATLSWTPEGSSHVQVLPIDTDSVVIDRDVTGGATDVDIPWAGLFRWRVASRDARGLEGPPSAEGLVCVLER